MDSYTLRLSLRVAHPSIDPGKITSELQIEPRRTWRAGEPKTTPKGTTLEGFWANSYWTAPIEYGEADTLPGALSAALEQLAAHRTFFHRIRSEGGKAEIFIGWFFKPAERRFIRVESSRPGGGPEDRFVFRCLSAGQTRER